MCLLKNKMFILLFTLLFIFSCKPKGPVSPEEAFIVLKNAYLSSDAAKIESVLSERSKEKIKTVIAIFSSMTDSQLKALGRRFNTDADSLKNLTIKDYLSLHLSQADKTGDILKEITDQKVIGVDITGSKAVARLENGMEIYFVKENHYWKFDMEELSSKE